ncbi:MAG: hypothetical protein AAFQ81_00900 [Pseudomonadota bacterium]
MKRSFNAFIADDRGTTVLETLVVFMPVMTLFYANIEIIMAYYGVVSAQKAAQLAARVAATESPVYIGTDMYVFVDGEWQLINRLNKAAYISNGPSCYQPSGPDGCLDPHILQNDDGVAIDEEGEEVASGSEITLKFECDGETVASDPDCDEERFNRLMCEVRRFYPSVNTQEVTIRYDYRRLGIAGGPFIPEITVWIDPRNLPVDLLGPIGFATLSGGQLGNAVASSIAEDLDTPAAADSGNGWCGSS